MAEHFFVIGAQRSGTTYLHRMLDAHPQIAMNRPLRPEPKFLIDSHRYGAGVTWYEATYFAHAEPGQLLGDKSAGYMDSEQAAVRIVESFPGARVVAILRDPVDRAVSHHRFSVESGLETLGLEEALRTDAGGRVVPDGEGYRVGATWVASHPFAYLRRGRYMEDLRPYLDLLGPERIHVTVFEATVGSVDALAALYRFLGVDAGFRPPDIGDIVNPSAAPNEVLDDPLRRELEEHFAPINEELAATFGLDLSPWPSYRR